MPARRLGLTLVLLSIPAAFPAPGQEAGFHREVPSVEDFRLLNVEVGDEALDGRGKVALWMEGSTVAHFRDLRISPAE